MEYIKIYKNPKYIKSKTENTLERNNHNISLGNSLKVNPIETSPLDLETNIFKESNSNENVVKPSPNILENSITDVLTPKNNTADRFRDIVELQELLPKNNGGKMYSLNNIQSGIGELEFTIESLTPVRLLAIIETKDLKQLVLPPDSIKRFGVNSRQSTVTLNLSHINKIRRLSLLTLDNTNGVMRAQNSTFDWSRTLQLNNIMPNTILLNLYNNFGKIFIREKIEYYYPNLRELATYNSYNKINWLNENTPIEN